MHIYDISLVLGPQTPIWPGDPGISLERVHKIEDGANSNVSRIEIGLHTGTHVDAPYHFLPEGKTVEKLNLKALTGRVYVLNMPGIDLITAAALEKSDIPPRTRRLLFKTRNSELWSKGVTEFHTDFVALDETAAKFLVDRGVKLIGVDYLSVSPYKNSRPVHEILLKAGVVVVEGLDLSKISQGRYTMYCLPLQIAGAEGAPARAILIGV